MNTFYFPYRIKVFLLLFSFVWTIGIAFSFYSTETAPIFALRHIRGPFMDNFFSAVNIWPEPITIVLIAAFYLMYKPYRFGVLFINVVIILPTTWGLKHYFSKNRPINDIGIHLADLLARDISFFAADQLSFPSGHSTSAAALAIFCLYDPYFNSRYYSLAFFMLAVLAAISRLYFGHHYLEDIIAGSILGTILSITITAYTESQIPSEWKKWQIFNW